MDRLRQDIRFAVRSLIKSPLITAAAIVSLGLGIGANASIFSAIDVFMFRPLDFEEADNLVMVWTNNRERGWTSTSTSAPDYADWRTESRTLELAAYTGAGVNLSGADRPERLEGTRVTANFFDVLRKQPVLGRGFTLEEERIDGPRVVVLGDAVWQRSFGADPGIVGRVVNLDGEPYEVIGVMPPRVGFGRERDVWLPLRFTGEESRSSRFLAVLGRIRVGADLERATAELNALQTRMAAAFPENAGNGATVIRLQEEWFDEGFRQGSLIAGTAVLFVLLIACANVANLLLARAAGREREVALRTAVGAGKGRILRQLLTESLVLALVGGAIGLLLSVVGIRWIRGLFPPGMSGVDGVTLNSRVVAFTAGISALAGLVFGIAPALRGTRLDLRGLLTDANRGNTGGHGSRLRSALVIAEISLSLVLLIASVLLVQAFVKLRTAPLGFRTDVVTAAVTLPATKYPGVESMDAFQTQLADRLAALPGVETVGAVHGLPMRSGSSRYYTIPEEPPPEPGREPIVNVRWVLPGYLETMGIGLSAGRTIERSDARDAPPVVVINERMAASHWAGRNPIGQRIRFADVDHEIVGVVADTREWGPDDEAPRVAYLAAQQGAELRTLVYVVRGSGTISSLSESIRETVRALDPEQPVYGLSTMAEITNDEISGSLAMAKVLGGLGIIAFLLSAVGVYGVMAYSVAQRTQELGIRMALGAHRGSVLGLVLRRGAFVTGTGILIGLVVAASVTRLLSFFLYGVSPYHPLAFASVPLALGLTGMLASLLPALRATRVDPLIALRAE